MRTEIEKKTIEDVSKFWEESPLFSGESELEVGSKEFFEEHRAICLEDGFAGRFSKDLLIPNLALNAKILDLGCGIGLWTVELQLRDEFKNIYAADLTQKALDLTRKRLDLYQFNATLSIQNAEKMTYEDGIFDHVNCQGVIHHTPDTESAVREIARVLKNGGTAHISVYYKNFLLKIWSKISIIGKILYKCGVRMKGRGREAILCQNDTDEIVRMFDGDKNPVGKVYTKEEALRMIRPYFDVEKTFLSTFPARAFPFTLPRVLRRFLTKSFGFQIHMHLRKK